MTVTLSNLLLYQLISEMQAEIGNDAEIRFAARDHALIIVCDWVEVGFRARLKFDEIDLAQIDEDRTIIDGFIAYCKHAYKNRSKQHDL